MLTREQKNNPVEIDALLRRLGYDPPPVDIRIEGREYVAPLSAVGIHNANASASAKNNKSQELKAAASLTQNPMAASLTQELKALLPASFDWRQAVDPITNQSILTPVYSQYAVGRCYIIGPTQSLSDRLTIQTGMQSPHISGFYFLSCGRKPIVAEGALGGDAMYICDLLATIGNVSGLCSLGLWCFESPSCIGGLATATELNKDIPPCSVYEPKTSPNFNDTSTFQGYAPECLVPDGCCLDCIGRECRQTGTTAGNGPRFKIDGSLTKRLATIDDIKHDILVNGPVITTFRVYNDLIINALPTSKYPRANQFQSTGGVYVNIAGKDVYGLSAANASLARNTSTTGSFEIKSSTSVADNTLISDQVVGNHTVSIVGWGTTRVSIPGVNQGQEFELPYWIVRNSWGNLWMEEGYFKMAQTNPVLGINVRCGLDLPFEVAPGIQFGGCISITPASETIEQLKQTNVEKVTWSLLERDSYLQKSSSFGSVGSRESATSAPRVASVVYNNSKQQKDAIIIYSSIGAFLAVLLVVLLAVFLTTRNSGRTRG